VNRTGETRFHKLFDAILTHEFPQQKVAVIQGVRAEESPSRLVGLTAHPTYKWATWGNQMRPPYLYAFYPLYDWSYTDIWHAIQSNGWKYNRIYDEFYRYGVPVREMRVSNLHHETAVRSLFILQEIDPDLYERLVDRLPGVQTAGKMQKDFYAKELPFMFLTWREYRDYLMEKLVRPNREWYDTMKAVAVKWDKMLALQPEDVESTARVFVQAILTNDYHGTKIEAHRVQFITRFIYDRADQRNWTKDDEYLRESDPEAFDWMVRQTKNPRHSWEANGTRYTKRGKYQVSLARPGVLRREVIAQGADTTSTTVRLGLNPAGKGD
jgi:predicted phosphoadenosine phosphosulfate sulfurtransferase